MEIQANILGIEFLKSAQPSLILVFSYAHIWTYLVTCQAKPSNKPPNEQYLCANEFLFKVS